VSARNDVAWRARPTLAAAIEVVSLFVPVVVASVVTWRVGLALPSMSLPVTLLVLAPVAVVAGLVMDRLARRLAPLSVLLRMAMVFPDRTPSRFAVAREAGHPRELTRRLTSPDVDEASAAGAVLSLVGALSAHDRRTRGHSERVRAYTDLLSERLGLTEADRDRLRWAGLLHDIGKLDVRSTILNKPGQPDASEWQELQQHPDHGARLAAPLLPWLGEWGDAIAHHHERYNGTGYPRGLAGEEISLGGRIVSVVDSFETMTASRSYKKAMSHRAAREELARCSGAQFDPVVVREFLQISLPRLLWAMGPLAALVQLPFLTTLRYAGSRAANAGGTAATALATPAIAAGVATALVSPGLATATTPNILAARPHLSAAAAAHVVRESSHSAVAPQKPVTAPTKANPAAAHRHEAATKPADHHQVVTVAAHVQRATARAEDRPKTPSHDAAGGSAPRQPAAPRRTHHKSGGHRWRLQPGKGWHRPHHREGSRTSPTESHHHGNGNGHGGGNDGGQGHDSH
jgi:putative nucleotidyltransferase with HDIG domain